MEFQDKFFGSEGLVVDGHSHVTLPIEKYIQLMDEAGIDKAILFRTMVHPETKGSLEEVQREMIQLGRILSGSSSVAVRYAQKANEELFEIVSKHPNRFYSFGIVPTSMELEDIIRSVKSQIRKYRILGLGEYTMQSGMISQLDKVFSASAHTAKLPIWVHCFNPITLDDILELVSLAEKYPTVPVIIGHNGGSNCMKVIDIAKEHSNIYVDLSASFSSLVLRLTIESIPCKVLFGVDYPYGDMLVSKLMIERAVKDNLIKSQVLGGNMIGLLNKVVHTKEYVQCRMV